jgi:hypothetical protein
MYTFLIITAVLVLIAITCLKKKLSMGIFPVVVFSSIISGILCVIINVSSYKIEGPDRVWSDTVYYRSSKEDISITERHHLINDLSVDVNSINKIVIRNYVKKPYVQVIEYKQRKDLNLLWDMEFNDSVIYTLYLNPKQYGVYKTVKNSLE